MSSGPQLVHRDDNTVVDVKLVRGLDTSDLLELQKDWYTDRVRIKEAHLKLGIVRQLMPQSLHWDWAIKSDGLDALEVSVCGLQFEGKWQGVMLTRTASYVTRLAPERLPLVYVDYIEAAPWNWVAPAIGQGGVLKGVGVQLIRQAVLQSKEEGFQGRVGLHALPQAEACYRTVCGMTDLGPDLSKQGLRYYEFSATQADAFLNGGVVR